MSDLQDKSAAPTDAARSSWERDTLEKLAFAMLQEQQAARRWKNGLRLAWLLFVVVVFWAGWSYNAPASSPTMPHTAMVAIRGEIAAEGDASAENVMAAMRSALEDNGSRALVLLINSPGGSPVQAGLISDEILRLKKLYGKPVSAVVEESCAAAAYYIAAAA
ncbi:MAG: S49 family peptidase, partial [Limnohabitans sp.]